jgi:hypothetical protein
MRKNTQSAADDADVADDADESFDGVRIEAIASPSSKPDQPDQVSPERLAISPGWAKRLSLRAKLARALVIVLAVIVALITFLPHASFTLPPQITRLLTPAPTQTQTPGRLSAGQLEQIPHPPVSDAATSIIAPSPQDPETAYTCMSPVQNAPATGLIPSEISLWVTHNMGRTWSHIALPGAIGTYCFVETARDGSSRVVMSVGNAALDQSAQPCAHDQYFVSDDSGVTWRAIQHTTLAPAAGFNGNCYLWATTRHLFMSTYIGGNSDQSGLSQEHSFLERSDDGGRTWQRADHDLGSTISGSWYAQPLDATGETLFTFLTNYSGPVLIQSNLWISHDAGATWRRVAASDLPTLTRGGQPITDMFTEAQVSGGPQACHCVFGVSYPEGSAPYIIGQHLYLSRDFAHWTLVPPIPVKGTSALRSGVYNTLGMTVDGRLLALGPDPQEGVPALPDHDGQVSGTPPALWAWNTHTGRWELAPTHIPCEDLQSCFVYPTAVSVAMGASGILVGTYFWVSVQTGSGVNGPPSQAYYRLYIPAD